MRFRVARIAACTLSALSCAVPALAVFGHELVPNTPNRIAVVDDFVEFIFDNDLVNTGDESDTLTLTIKNEYFPGGGEYENVEWTWALCTSVACVAESTGVVLAPAQQESISVHVTPVPIFEREVIGGTRTTLTIRSHGDPSSVSTHTFIGIHSLTDTLLIDDDGGADYERLLADSFRGLGSAFAVWETAVQPLDAAALARMETAVWATGDAGRLSPLGADLDLLAGFLDTGGSLLASGQDLLDAVGGTPFAAAYLDAGRIADSGSRSVEGTATDPIADGLAFGIDGGDGASNQLSPDVVAGALPVFHYDDWTPAGVRTIGTTFRTVTLGFGLEAIDDEATRRLLLANAFDWLGSLTPIEGCPDCESPGTGPSVAGPILAGPNPFTHHARVRFATTAPLTPVLLRIFAADGSCVRTLADGETEAGVHSILWDGRDASGRAMAPGVFFYALRLGAEEWSGRLVRAR
jgi:hypothetical protein